MSYLSVYLSFNRLCITGADSRALNWRILMFGASPFLSCCPQFVVGTLVWRRREVTVGPMGAFAIAAAIALVTLVLACSVWTRTYSTRWLGLTVSIYVAKPAAVVTLLRPVGL